MKKTKKLIVLAMMCIMLFGATLAVHAAECPHSPSQSTSTKTVSGVCDKCKQSITYTHVTYTVTCTRCGALLTSYVTTTPSHTH